MNWKKLGWPRRPFFRFAQPRSWVKAAAEETPELLVRDLCRAPEADPVYQAYLQLAYAFWRRAMERAVAPELSELERAYQAGQASAFMEYIVTVESAREQWREGGMEAA